MGCDIHGVIEVNNPEPWEPLTEWMTVGLLNSITPRNYTIFGYLFGVRGESPLPYENRGYPPHVSWYTRSIYCDMCDGDHDGPCEAHMPDWHSLTYITWNELAPHLQQVREMSRNESGWHLVWNMMEYLASLYPSLDSHTVESVQTSDRGVGEVLDTSRVRMVVWFDN